MLVNANPYLSQGLVGTYLFQKKRRFSLILSSTLSYLSACVDSREIAGVQRKARGRQEASRNRKMLYDIEGTVESNAITEETSEELQLAPAYEAAMEALSSLITQKKRGARSAVVSKYGKSDRMLMYVKILGLQEHLAGLKIIHVAGTKGKGSTCAFCEAILLECGFRTGLFTSPHLIDVKERYRLNGLDISEDKFLHYFWDCWNQLKENVSEDLPMPPLFQFLTVLAFKIFVCEKVDVAIIEVGMGGRDDSTNVIKEPVVCGITSLGMDHMEVLGDTLREIASHKAGILKPRVPAFTVAQQREAMDVLQERANELMIPLKIVSPLDCKNTGIALGLSGDHQFMNASLAVALCKSWLHSTGNWNSLFQQVFEEDTMPEAFLRGLSAARLPGRAQVLLDPYLKSYKSSEIDESSGELVFYLDGAHTLESMEACARWFAASVKENGNRSFSSCCPKVGTTEEYLSNGYIQDGKRDSNKILKTILLFNCMEARDPGVLLPQLVDTCASLGTNFSKAIFAPSMSTYNKVTSGASAIPLVMPSEDLTWQFKLQRIWEKIIHGKDVLDESVKMDTPLRLPPLGFLAEDVSHCSPKDGHFLCSAVISSLPLTINWLRECVKANPSIKFQVLVTGSLHLVGDVLKLLKYGDQLIASP